MMINASFVFGPDSDTPQTFKATLDWIVAQKIETVTSHILTPYPGTKLYDQMLSDGRILSFDLRRYNTAHVVFSPAMTMEAVFDSLHDDSLCRPSCFIEVCWLKYFFVAAF